MRRLLSILLMLALLIPGAPALADSTLSRETDARGIALPADMPQRVVCLYGSFAEAWLYAGGTLVGVTDDATKERGLELSEDVQIVGTNKEPNPELILALEPDLVIGSADIEKQLTIVDTLESAGVPCAMFRVDTCRDFADLMSIFTGWTGETAVFEQEVQPMIAEIERITADATAQQSPTVLLLRAFSSGVKAKGADNLAGVMLADLGCDNIVDRYPSLLEELTLESIVAENPDVILVSIMGSDEDAALAALEESVGSNPAWQALDAVQQGRVYVLPKELFHYKPNLRWAESYAYLYELLFEE